jgi:hypothetical protein
LLSSWQVSLAPGGNPQNNITLSSGLNACCTLE